MVLVKPGPAEILRSSQKDEFVVGKLQQLCDDAFHRLAGPRLLIKYKKWIQYVGQLLYYGNTTVSGLQTLGEEYTGILQVQGSFESIPPLLNRITMVLFHCFGQQMVEHFLAKLDQAVRKSEEMNPDAKNQILKWISFIKMFLPVVEVLHKALFFCSWDTYHLSKRFTNIHYVLIRYWLRNRKSSFGFRLLGGITLANSVLFVIHKLHDFWNLGDNFSQDNSGLEPVTTYGNAPMKSCTMCLNPLKDPTATMCGHVYCWNCIHDWLQNEDMCPVCRETVLRHRLIPLMNYL